ncbi:MAG: hypothetical protein AAGI08_01670 [Bacteroidota bacterium]
MPKNIARIDTRNTHGFQVRVTRHGTRHTKFFADRKYKGRENALQAAIDYRDKLIDELPEPMTPAEVAQSRSLFGVAGIRLGIDTTGPNPIPCVVADSFIDGKRSIRSFSLRKWPVRRALWSACQWKAQKLYDNPSSERVQEMYETAYPRVLARLEKEYPQFIRDEDRVE